MRGGDGIATDRPAAPAGARAPIPRGTPATVPTSLSAPKEAVALYDVVILGAGCAGLSLCLALLEAGMSGPILMVDSRPSYLDDRTWCFWDVEPTRFTHLARSRWSTWQVRDADGSVTATADATPYVCLAATDFYTFALASIAEHGNVELRLGERAGSVAESAADPGAVQVQTASGPVRALQVVDSRGMSASSVVAAAAHSESIWLPQQFVGLHILADRPVFDPGECRLMDFAVDQSRGLRFMYVLPTSPFEALVENVYMAETRIDGAEHRRQIEAYLLSEFGLRADEFAVVGDERGYIPMTDHRFVRRPSARVTTLGMIGGATRPSTGYTFLGIQRACRELVNRLVAEGAVDAGSTRGAGSLNAVDAPCSLLDAIFLRFLVDYPERAPRVFRLLFGRVETASLVRFLTERSGVLDHARLILALPKLPFLASAARVIAHSLRRDAGGGPRARRR